MWHHEPLKLALAVGCKFSIYANLHIFHALLVCWSAPGAQTIHRPLGLAYPSLPFQLSRSGCGRNALWLLSTHTPHFPSQGKKHWGETWLLLKSHLGMEARYGGRWIRAAASGSWRMSQVLAVQHVQGSFVQLARHGVHTKLKGKCQFLLILARIKTNTELWYFWNKTIKRNLSNALTHYWKSLTCWLLKFLFKLSLSHTNAGMIPTYYSSPVNT